MANKVCPTCGHVGKEQQRPKGSLAAEVMLFLGAVSLYYVLSQLVGLLLLVAAFLYSFWRSFAPQDRSCPACGQPGMIPVDSPRGRELTAKNAALVKDEASKATEYYIDGARAMLYRAVRQPTGDQARTYLIEAEKLIAQGLADPKTDRNTLRGFDAKQEASVLMQQYREEVERAAGESKHPSP